MKTAIVKLKSVSPYSQSKHYTTEKLAKEIPKDYEARTWRDRLHTILGFTVSAEFLRHFGFEPAYTNKNARLYHAQDFPRICHALSRHVLKVGQGVAQA